MKRILGVLISSVMLAVSCLIALPASAKEKYTEYIVPFYSDQIKQKQVVGLSNESLLKDGIVFIPIETACEIAGASIAAETDEAVIITRNYVSWCCEYKDEKNQYLLIDSNTGKGYFYKSALKCLTESSWSGTSFKYSLDDEGIINLLVDNFNQTNISCKYYDDELYVSFYEFLVMMGVDVDLINHEAINEITAFYTSMAEEYSGDEDYKTVASEIDKLFSAGTGYEQFFYCYLGTPIDELYKAYYDNDLMCDLEDYYGDGKVEWANLVNAVENYDGLTKTALAALNLNTDYEDVLINTVTYHGDSEDDNFSKTVDDSVDIIQRLLYVRDFGLSVEEIYRDDSVLETVWRMQEKTDNIEPILSSVDDFDVDFSLSSDAISMVYSGLCGAMKNYAKYREMSNLFEGEQYLMKNTILSSDAMASNTTDEARGMFISHILNPMGNVIEMHSNLRNEENSYFNLYHSAAKVQETMNASSPTAWAAVWGAIEEATYSAGDDLIMGVIDYTFFGGMPVSSLVNSGILFCVDGLKNTAYGKEQSQIAELDDYVFIQEVANDCFKEHSLASENARSSFILGLKATMLAYKTNGEDSSWDPNNKDSDSIKAFYAMATANGEAEAERFYATAERQKTQIAARISQLDNIIRCLYEDRVTGRITPERYDTMASGYELEQAELRQELQCITKKIDEMDLREMYVKEFIAKAKTYIEMPELTPELLRVFIRRIEVYEKAEKYSRTCGNRIMIHYTFQAGSGQRADAVADEASEMALLPA